ncbi:MAG: hypothetical protein ACJ788_13560 [Ktedonobacteraceae bacterium]|jgi:hypothetical protein
MSGAFPYVPEPNPEDEKSSQTEFIEETPEGQLTGEQFAPEQPEMLSEEQTAAAPPSATELPPEAQGETNGGPLGCCLGITVGIMLSLFFGVIGFGRVTANLLVFLIHADAITNIRIATGFFVIIGIILGGYVGWKIGKRIYREYELSPRQKKKLEALERKYKPRPKEARS